MIFVIFTKVCRVFCLDFLLSLEMVVIIMEHFVITIDVSSS